MTDLNKTISELKTIRAEIDALKEKEIETQNKIISMLEELGVDKYDLDGERVVIKASKVLDKKEAQKDEAWVVLQEKIADLKKALKPIEEKYKKIGRKFVQIVKIKQKEDGDA